MSSLRILSVLRVRVLDRHILHPFIDLGIVCATLWMAYFIRFDGSPPALFDQEVLLITIFLGALYVGLNHLWGVYRFIWRFTGLKEVSILAASAGCTGFLVLFVGILVTEFYPVLAMPFGVMAVHPALVFLGLAGVRLLGRASYEEGIKKKRLETSLSNDSKRLLLIGAGQAGLMLVRDLESRPEVKVVGFLDDDPLKMAKVIHGVPVLGSTEKLGSILTPNGVDEVVLSMPSASPKVMRRIVKSCEEIPVRVSSVPSLFEVVVGKVAISRLRSVRMEDLLGRASVAYSSNDAELIDCYQGSKILITGAGGSIGSELARQLRGFHPAGLILVDKDENSLYEIGVELNEDFQGLTEEVVADIRDIDRMSRLLDLHRPNIVFHAAAYKHVPMMEKCPTEAVLNNVVGTRNLVETSVEHGVENFVLISTDKAVNPTSIMGASKRLAELLVQKGAQRQSANRFCCVRFGNVLGSRASVVPLFQRQIAEGRDITVTHPDVTRYFMTIPEAVQLVIQAGSLGEEGQVFLLEMGDPVKVVDMARELIELSGLTPDKDVKIEFTGLRPGEKLYEELLTGSENGVRSTRYPKIFVSSPVDSTSSDVDEVVKELEAAANNNDTEAIYRLLESVEIGYCRPRWK